MAAQRIGQGLAAAVGQGGLAGRCHGLRCLRC
jgi:hypothetical protein